MSQQQPTNRSPDISLDTIIGVSLFFDSPSLRIFVTCSSLPHAPIECWSRYVGHNDVVLLVDWSPVWGKLGGHWKRVLEGSHEGNVIFLSGTVAAHADRLEIGVCSHLISNNIVINENIFLVQADAERIYDAVYTARATAFKRIELASSVDNVALVVDRWFNSRSVTLDEGYRQVTPTWINDHRMTPPELNDLYNKSRTGLILSTFEGACLTVTEYLLCGVPVVSTKPEHPKGLGGRELWLTEDNSIYIDPTPEAVFEGVRSLVRRNLSRDDIRSDCIDMMQAQRSEIAEKILTPLFAKHDVSTDPYALMTKDCWYEKWPHRHKLSPEPNALKLNQFIDLLKSGPQPSGTPKDVWKRYG